MMRAPDKRLGKALALFNPPPARRDRVAKRIQTALDSVEGWTDKRDHKRESAGLTRYVDALRELRASHAALDPSMHSELPPLAEASVIKRNILRAELMLISCSRPGGQPANTRAQSAVVLAGALLMAEGIKLTTERKAQWHLLSQIFADTSRDLRHHLTACWRCWQEQGLQDMAAVASTAPVEYLARLLSFKPFK